MYNAITSRNPLATIDHDQLTAVTGGYRVSFGGAAGEAVKHLPNNYYDRRSNDDRPIPHPSPGPSPTP